MGLGVIGWVLKDPHSPGTYMQNCVLFLVGEESITLTGPVRKLRPKQKSLRIIF